MYIQICTMNVLYLLGSPKKSETFTTPAQPPPPSPPVSVLQHSVYNLYRRYTVPLSFIVH